MEIDKVLENISDRFYNSAEYKLNQEFFDEKFISYRALALDYIFMHLKDCDLFCLVALIPEYNKSIGGMDFNNCEFMSEEGINQYILYRKANINEQTEFYSKFLQYLILDKPEWFVWLNNLIVEDLHLKKINSELFLDPQKNLKIIEIYLSMLTASDIFDMMSSNDIEIFKSKIESYKEIICNKEIENLKLKKTIEKLNPKIKSVTVTKKQNLIKLLDFCNECLKKDPNLSPKKMIEKFEDELKNFGSWKTWEKFFTDNYETIKVLTELEQPKKIYSLFSINNNRDKIDMLYSIMELKI